MVKPHVNKIVTGTWLHLYLNACKNPSKMDKNIVISWAHRKCTWCSLQLTNWPKEVTHIWVCFFTTNISLSMLYKMTSNTFYIPPSDDDSSDIEVFQHFLESNKIQQITTAQYQPVSPNLVYSELAPFQPSTTWGKIVISLCKNKLTKYLICIYTRSWNRFHATLKHPPCRPTPHKVSHCRADKGEDPLRVTIGHQVMWPRVTCPLIGQSEYRTLAVAAGTPTKGDSGSARRLVGWYVLVG